MTKLEVAMQRGAGDKNQTPRAVLQKGLSDLLGRSVRIASMISQPLATQSTHAIDRLKVTLASGEQLWVIFKRLSAVPGSKDGRAEVLIYRRLLGGQRFSAPALYASAYNKARGRYWLFLEDVGEWSIKTGAHEHWLAAVGRRAEMHGTYLGREDELRELGCLTEHDSAYYRKLAETARHHLDLAGAKRALGHFDGLMSRFDSVVAYLVRQPATLVHGDIFSGNLLIDSACRVRLVDWESAGIGLAALDLARLLDGWGSQKRTFVAAYLAELDRHATVPVDRQAFRSTLAHCGIINALWHFAWSVEACADTAIVNGLLRKMQTVGRRLEMETPHV